MAQKMKFSGLIAALLCLFGLAACSSPTPTSTPTLDLNPFRTEVAATVLAQVTQDLALTPSAPPAPISTATYTPTATAVQATGLAPAKVTDASTSLTLTLATLATGTAAPTVVLADRAQWVSQTIPDDTTFAPNQAFTITWRLKNVGESTWTAAYLLRFYSGNIFGAPKEVVLGQAVPPGGTIDITLKMRAPEIAGKYRSDWVLSNEKRGNFKEPVYLAITVVLPATPTRTPTPSATP